MPYDSGCLWVSPSTASYNAIEHKIPDRYDLLVQ